MTDSFSEVYEKAVRLAAAGQTEEGGQILDEFLQGVRCTPENQLDFLRAASFFQVTGCREKAQRYREIEESCVQTFLAEQPAEKASPEEEPESAEEEKMQPVLKPKKIYPNDPCPCGSGKKYKRCCGLKKAM